MLYHVDHEYVTEIIRCAGTFKVDIDFFACVITLMIIQLFADFSVKLRHIR